MSRSRPVAPWVELLVPDRPGATQDVVLGELRRVIVDGHAPPGCLIVVDDVAARFDVSRIPVRESLKTLIGEGLVDHQLRGDYTVARLTRAELGELYVVREALENAALNAAVPRATAADDAELEAAHAALSAAIEAGDARGHHRESRRFHFAMAEPSRMYRLLQMFAAAWNTTEPQQPMSAVTSEMTVALHNDHRDMLDAFRARDAERLLAVSAEHYRRLQVIVAGLPETP